MLLIAGIFLGLCAPVAAVQVAQKAERQTVLQKQGSEDQVSDQDDAIIVEGAASRDMATPRKKVVTGSRIEKTPDFDQERGFVRTHTGTAGLTMQSGMDPDAQLVRRGKVKTCKTNISALSGNAACDFGKAKQAVDTTDFALAEFYLRRVEEKTTESPELTHAVAFERYRIATAKDDQKARLTALELMIRSQVMDKNAELAALHTQFSIAYRLSEADRAITIAERIRALDPNNQRNNDNLKSLYLNHHKSDAAPGPHPS